MRIDSASFMMILNYTQFLMTGQNRRSITIPFTRLKAIIITSLKDNCLKFGMGKMLDKRL